MVAVEPITREVLFANCPTCGRRFEREPDSHGNGVTLLYQEMAQHIAEAKEKPLALNDFKRMVRVENVVPKTLDISEIISKRQLRRRARRLARHLDVEDAVKAAEQQIRDTILKELQSGELHTCACCGKPITKEHAEKNNGMGPKCANGTHKCGSGEEE